MPGFSRREFVRLAAAGAAASPFVEGGDAWAASLTAQEIVDRIKTNLGVNPSAARSGQRCPSIVDGIRASVA